MAPLLDVQAASKAFGGVQALRGVTMSVAEGSVTGLIGPNGAGKTTLFNVITGFARPDGGRVAFAGERIDRLAPWQIARRGLTRTFQTSAGFPHLTVWENLMTAGSGGRAEMATAGLAGRGAWRDDQVAVDRRANALLARLALTSLRDARVSDLSAAHTKLVELLRQLMLRPRLLLLDEPASGFGPDRLASLAALIRELNAEGVTVLVIEHNLAFVMKLASQVYVLAGGTVISAGPPEQVVRDPAVVSNYLGAGA